jgi:hypothetical protein
MLPPKTDLGSGRWIRGQETRMGRESGGGGDQGLRSAGLLLGPGPTRVT